MLLGATMWIALLASRVALAVVQIEVVGPDGSPVRDAVVSLEPIDAATGRLAPYEAGSGRAPRAAVMDQIDLAFEPHVLPVEVGTLVDFPNSDQVRHSIYSFSTARTFEIKLYRGREVPPIRFDRSGVAVLGCNIHDDMLAFVYILETPHFAVTTTEGRAVIAGVAAGRYLVRVRHPRIEASVVLEREEVLEPDGLLRLTLSSRPPPRAAPREAPEDGLDGLFGARGW